MRQECGACGGSTPTWSDVCAGCGLVLQSARRLRTAGVVYLVLGSFLSIVGTYLMLVITGVTSYLFDPPPNVRISGGIWGALLVYGGVSFVILVGVVVTLMGVWQILYGRRNLKLVRVIIVCYIIFWIAGLLLQIFNLAGWLARGGDALPGCAMRATANSVTLT